MRSNLRFLGAALSALLIVTTISVQANANTSDVPGYEVDLVDSFDVEGQLTEDDRNAVAEEGQYVGDPNELPPADTAGSSAFYSDMRAKLDALGGASIPIVIKSQVCNNSAAIGCASMSTMTISIASSVASRSSAWRYYVLAHEMGHIYHFRQWSIVNANSTYKSLFKSNPEHLADCFASVKGRRIEGKGYGCSQNQLNFAKRVLNQEFKGTGSDTPVVNQPPPAPNKPPEQPNRYIPTVNISGSDRYDTNLAINKLFSNDGPAFVAVGTAFADSLSVAPAAASKSGKLYLTGKTSMKPEMVSEIRRAGHKEIYIIGGVSAIADSVVDQLAQATGVAPVRISGSTRYATASEIVSRFYAGKPFTRIFLATGTDFPDALSASSAAGMLDAPVLLVNPGASQVLQPEIAALIKSNPVSQLIVVGGESAIPKATVDKVVAETRFMGVVRRLSGSSRYDTNVAVNNYLTESGAGSRKELWIAAGADFPDALSAAVPASLDGRRLVLSSKNCVTRPVISTWINGPSSKIDRVNIIGGTSTLGPNVLALMECQ